MNYTANAIATSLKPLVFVLTVVAASLTSAAADPAPKPDKQVAADTGLTAQVVQIDKMIAEVWDAYQINPSKPASDSEWCRRVFLDIIGRIPTAQEASAFASDTSNDKKKKLVEMLLHDDDYTEEFARNWTTVWTNLLIGRTGGTEKPLDD